MSEIAPRLSVPRSEEHTSELQSHDNLVCRLLLEKTKNGCPAMQWTYERPRPPAPRFCSAAATRRAARPGGPPRSPGAGLRVLLGVFFFNDTATTEIYTLSLHDALPISSNLSSVNTHGSRTLMRPLGAKHSRDRKSTRLNSSHTIISYAVFCLKNKR